MGDSLRTAIRFRLEPKVHRFKLRRLELHGQVDYRRKPKLDQTREKGNGHVQTI
jgi:hypothetical protein